MTLPGLIRSSNELRLAILVPIIISLVFSFFNLTSAVNQQESMGALRVAAVNLDEGISSSAGTTLRIGEQVIAGLSAALPFKLDSVADEATARKALDDGEIAAALILPPDFSRAVAGGGTAAVTVLYSDHRSVLEARFGQSLSAQVQAGLSVAVMVARIQLAAPQEAARPPAANAGPTPPPVIVSAEALHPAKDPLLLQVPFVLAFAGWLGALVGSILLFLGTRSVLSAETVRVVSAARIAIPLIAALGTALMAALLTTSLTGTWGEFLELWGFRWLASAAATSMIMALFAWFGFFALLLAVPLVFYQGAVSGLLVPARTAPDWIGWLDDLLPLSEMAQGMRTILIGGPEGSVPWLSVALMLVLSLALIWLGTMVWARWRPVAVTAGA